MSVINKVLRDLDQRQGAGTAAPTAADQRLRSGTTSVTAPAVSVRVAPPTPVRWGVLGGFALALGLLAGGAALWQTGRLGLLLAKTDPSGLAPAAPAPRATSPVPAVAVPMAQGAVKATEPPAAPAPSSVRTAAASRFESTLVLPRDLKPAASQPSVPAPVPVDSTSVVAKPPAQTITVAAPSPTVSPLPPPALTAAELAQKQQQAARDALAQAQALWNAGSRDPAVDLLQQAIVSTERAAQAPPSAGSTQTLVLLVREFGRMQLAEGRPGAVWDTLTRLEPVLRSEPEMWALRANAAQRLGRHQDSVHAYMTALQSRPNEQRWLLGAAVSLAALGQTTSAAEMAEKARAAGPISREVQTYLRQMGVSLKDL
ncbi:MAG: hypothetical protein KGN32_05410 [Burkholderiales bacterium]|nr:hypothetical protein [Burkholderiales bacterium]